MCCPVPAVAAVMMARLTTTWTQPDKRGSGFFLVTPTSFTFATLVPLARTEARQEIARAGPASALKQRYRRSGRRSCIEAACCVNCLSVDGPRADVRQQAMSVLRDRGLVGHPAQARELCGSEGLSYPAGHDVRYDAGAR